MFQNLLAWGEVETDGERYRYVQVEPPYIFGPREEVLRCSRNRNLRLTQISIRDLNTLRTPTVC